MTPTELANFRNILKAKQAELTKTRGLESIAIERSADVLEEADYKTARELAIAGRRRLEAVPWTSLCIRCQEAADRGEESVLESLEPGFLDAA